MNSFGQDSNELHTVDLCNLHSALSPQQLFSPGLIQPCPEAMQCSLLPKTRRARTDFCGCLSTHIPFYGRPTHNCLSSSRLSSLLPPPYSLWALLPWIVLENVWATGWLKLWFVWLSMVLIIIVCFQVILIIPGFETKLIILDKVFISLHIMDLSFYFTNIPWGAYLLSLWKINSDFC